MNLPACKFVPLEDLPRTEYWTGPVALMHTDGTVFDGEMGYYIDINEERCFSPMWVNDVRSGIEKAAFVTE